MKRSKSYLWRAVALILAIAIQSSCGSTKTSQGASTGALIGAGIGLMSDTADDKKKRQEQKDRELAILEKSSITNDPKTAYSPDNSNQLIGSTWRVISLVDEKNATPDFASIILTFQTNTRATTLILWQDGKSETYGESYSVVSDVLIFTGKDYVTNTKFSVNNKQMVLVSPTMRVVLEEIEEGI